MTKRESFLTPRNLFILMFCIGLVQIAGYYLAGMLAGSDGGMPVPQPDTLLYCQAARRIAEGGPFSYSAGTAASTGTTSVLYPFILAIPYALGATGDTLLMAGFWLNAVFYLVFLWGWGQAFRKWLDSPAERTIATLLLALTGQPVYCALAQSDIGCWLAVSALLAMGLARNKPALYGPMLLVGPWVRPEGMVCALAFFMVIVLRRLVKAYAPRSPSARATTDIHDAVLALGGLVSTAGVFVLNHALTGEAQFSSVANKGYFKLMPFSLAVYSSAGDFFAILKGTLLGLSKSIPRDTFLFPLLGGVAVAAGGLTLAWTKKTRRQFPVFLLAAFGGILTVAHSGWQDTNYDRYLVWTSPVALILLAAGITFLGERLPHRLNRALLPAVFLLFSAGGSLFSFFAFNRAAQCSDPARQFAHACEDVLPKGVSVGAFGNCGLAYGMSARRFAHLSGIYSPEFRTRYYKPGVLSILKHRPETRFDYWLEDIEEYREIFGKQHDGAEQLLSGPDGLTLTKADWRPFENARFPRHAPERKELVDAVDVAFEADEKRADYEIIDRYGRPGFHPFIRRDALGSLDIIDCGRVLSGGDAMTVNLRTNKEVTVVMRTLPRQKVHSYSFSRRMDEFSFANPLSMRISVNGTPGELVSVSYATNGFSDVSFTLPAAAITSTPARLAFLGDHIACGYWFYQ